MAAWEKEDVVKLIRDVGAPLAFAILFLLMFMGLLPSPMMEASRIIASVDKKVDVITGQHDAGQKILKAICLNTSKSDDARARCLE